MVPKRHPSFRWTCTYPCYYVYKDIRMVPVEYDKHNNLIYMVRVLTKEVYHSIPVKPKPCLVTLPVEVIVDSTHYVLSEEACFFSQLVATRKRINANQTENVRQTRKKLRG